MGGGLVGDDDEDGWDMGEWDLYWGSCGVILFQFWRVVEFGEGK